nr:MAG TPA: hypothetical protein [Caudoviricetes sp.]
MAPRTPRSSEIMGLAFLPRSLGVPALRVSLFLSVILLAPLEKLVGGLDDPGLFKHRDSFGHPHRLFSLDAFLSICRPFHRGGTLHNCAVPHRIQQVHTSLRRRPRLIEFVSVRLEILVSSESLDVVSISSPADRAGPRPALSALVKGFVLFKLWILDDVCAVNSVFSHYFSSFGLRVAPYSCDAW